MTHALLVIDLQNDYFPGGKFPLWNTDVVLEVRDTGIGIKEEDKPFIFERFYKSFSGGLGLGLAIVRELVHAHGGTINVRSSYGSGSVFSVRLPD